MVLAPPKRKLGLQEQIASVYHAAGNGCGNPLTDGGLMVVASLIGRVDAAKTVSQSQLHERLSSVFFPGCAIQEARNSHALNQPRCFVGHDASIFITT
jgi:hypothetical protein